MGEIKVEDVPKMVENLKITKAIIFVLCLYPKGTQYALSKFINSEHRDSFKVIYPDKTETQRKGVKIDIDSFYYWIA